MIYPPEQFTFLGYKRLLIVQVNHECVDCCPKSDSHGSYWLAASSSLQRHLSKDSRHFAFLLLSLFVQSCCNFSFGSFLYKQDSVQDKIIRVDLCNMKFNINLFRVWDNSPSASTFFFKMSASSFWPNILMLAESSRQRSNIVHRVLRYFNVPLNVAKKYSVS